MAFVIQCRSIGVAERTLNTLRDYIDRSRFTVRVLEVEEKRRSTRVIVRDVRLREKKDYCGNHAGPCPLTGRKHTRLRYLEGLDWVSWNDMLNDALDSLGHDGNVASSHCIIRKDSRRRMDY